MAKALLERIKGYLEAHHVLTLATADEGGPWATSLFYASDDALNLYVLSDPATRHGRAIAHDARVAATVHGENREWTAIQGIQLWGTADEVKAHEEVFARYTEKFPFAAALISPDGPHRFYEIRPRWIRLIDNSRGLGFKEEITLAPRRVSSES
jgi:uncharacterized protein YhbP (UPF0306 family)